MSVITSVIHIRQNCITKNQYSEEMDPTSWLYRNDISTQNIVESVNTLINNCYIKFEKLRNNFILERLNKVYMEFTHDNSDFIDKLINDENLQIPSSSTGNDPNDFLEHRHPAEPP